MSTLALKLPRIINFSSTGIWVIASGRAPYNARVTSSCAWRVGAYADRIERNQTHGSGTRNLMMWSVIPGSVSKLSTRI